MVPDPTRSKKGARVALVIPTLNANRHLDRLLPALRSQTLVPTRFLIVDSSSRDDTAARFQAAGAEVATIASESFDHGATRQMAVEMLADAEFVIFLTQDAIPAHPEAFSNLIAPFQDSKTGMTYGRQLPAPGAKPIGAHARLYNYSDRSHAVSLADVPRYGIKTVFCSNSFAAYRREALAQAGGFPAGTIFGEDMLAAASILRNGWTIHYAAEARVHHSHDYGLAEEFRRYFDIGVLHDRRSELLRAFGRAEGEGIKYLRSELRYLSARAAHRVPEALLRSALKYGGYRLGRGARCLPDALNAWLSMNRRYWSRQTADRKIPNRDRRATEDMQTGH